MSQPNTERTSKEKLEEPTNDQGNTGGAVYTRWGSRQCRTGASSTLVYEGAFQVLMGEGHEMYVSSCTNNTVLILRVSAFVRPFN